VETLVEDINEAGWEVIEKVIERKAQLAQFLKDAKWTKKELAKVLKE